MRPLPGTHTPRPNRGELLPCLHIGGHDDSLYAEVWCHPDDTANMLAGGIASVNGLKVRAVLVVDRLPYADTLRVEFNKPQQAAIPPKEVVLWVHTFIRRLRLVGRRSIESSSGGGTTASSPSTTGSSLPVSVTT